jgi:hypothetical protein
LYGAKWLQTQCCIGDVDVFSTDSPLSRISGINELPGEPTLIARRTVKHKNGKSGDPTFTIKVSMYLSFSYVFMVGLNAENPKMGFP